MNKDDAINTLVQYSEVEKYLLEHDGEISDAYIEKLVDTVIKNKSSAVDYLDDVILSLLYNSERIASKCKQLSTVAKRLNHNAEKIKDKIKSVMVNGAIKTLEGEFAKYICYEGGKKVLIVDDEKIPNKYLKTKIVVEIDREQIKEDLMKGEIVEGAELKEFYTLKTGIVTRKEKVINE